eukprot:2939799-Alexandrium_andersonii.AAC.1
MHSLAGSLCDGHHYGRSSTARCACLAPRTRRTRRGGARELPESGARDRGWVSRTSAERSLAGYLNAR